MFLVTLIVIVWRFIRLGLLDCCFVIFFISSWVYHAVISYDYAVISYDYAAISYEYVIIHCVDYVIIHCVDYVAIRVSITIGASICYYVSFSSYDFPHP